VKAALQQEKEIKRTKKLILQSRDIDCAVVQQGMDAWSAHTTNEVLARQVKTIQEMDDEKVYLNLLRPLTSKHRHF
jgi:hypothetical protein